MFLDRDEAKPLLALLWVLRSHSLENLKSIYLSLEHLVTISRLYEGRLALIFVFHTGLWLTILGAFEPCRLARGRSLIIHWLIPERLTGVEDSREAGFRDEWVLELVLLFFSFGAGIGVFLQEWVGKRGSSCGWRWLEERIGEEGWFLFVLLTLGLLRLLFFIWRWWWGIIQTFTIFQLLIVVLEFRVSFDVKERLDDWRFMAIIATLTHLFAHLEGICRV